MFLSTQKMGSSQTDGWVFRLKIPRSSNGGHPGGTAPPTQTAVADESVELLPKNGLIAKPSSGGDESDYVAELSPHGASVTATPARPLDPSGAGADGTDGGWSYSSASSASQWNVTSSKLMSVTYRPAHEALPSYTNRTMTREVWSRSFGTCLSKPCGKKRRFARTLAGAPEPIHRVRIDYTVDDILHVDSIVAKNPPAKNSVSSNAEQSVGDVSTSGVWIRGVGYCHALRIYLKPKFGSCADIEKNDLKVEAAPFLVDQKNEFDLPPMEQFDNLDTKDDKSANVGRMRGPVLTFAVPCQWPGEKTLAVHKCPPLLWKVEHPPNPNVAIDSFCVMNGSLQLHQRGATTSPSHGAETPTNVYVNGYQSWSFSGSVLQGEPQPKSAMPNVLSAAFNRGGMVLSAEDSKASVDSDYWNDGMGVDSTDWSARDDESDDELTETSAYYKSDMFACISSSGKDKSQHKDNRVQLDEEGGPALIAGFLAQREQYGAVLMDKQLRKFGLYACHQGVVARKPISTDWAFCQVVDSHCYDEEAMVYYVHAVGDHNDARPLEKGLTTGWCSWYHYYADISHDSLAKNAHILAKSRSSIGFNVCLIDDGYMTSWGDWTSLKPGKFAKEGGMRVLADAMRSKGMKPGVWLAPFACDKGSDLARQHPDWIIRNDAGRIANSANCGKFFYGLDATNPAVRKHVYDTIRRAVRDWGFEVLKLDFLYASCLEGNGKYDPSMSRAEAMYLGLRTIRAAAGRDTFIIGCGCPIGSAVGFADGMRVSCDTGPTYVPEFPLPHWDSGTLPALKGMLRNTMTRAVIGHRWWHNDPDCLLLGETTSLTDDEVVSAASIIALTGGMLLLSDDMEKVSEKRLSVAKRVFPLTGVTAVPLDLHSTTNVMPSILRLWCSERTDTDETADPKEMDFTNSSDSSNPEKVLKEQASRLTVEVGYSPGAVVDPYSRERSCFPVASGLGSWTLVSISNWLEKTATVSVSFSALVSHSIEDFVAAGAPRSAPRTTGAPPPSSGPGEFGDNGFHVFSFWKAEYVWIPHGTLLDGSPLMTTLRPHATEILHVKPVDPSRPQYVGSDLHFSCGFEVKTFEWSDKSVRVILKNDYKKCGSVYLFLPERVGIDRASVHVCGRPSRFETVARPSIGPDAHQGRVIRVGVEIVANGEEDDGEVSIKW